MKKRFLRLLSLVLALCLLAGCGENAVPDPTDSATEPSSEVQSPEDTLRFGITGDSLVMTELSQAQRLTPMMDRAAGDTQTKEYTILVYIVGSNLESQAGCASTDIQEMLSSGLDADKCNLVIYTGGSKSWDLDIPSDCNTVWTMTEDGSSLEMTAATEQSVNMGDPAAFLDFLCFGYNYFPAEHYGLICWDHGGGPLYGYGNDELYGYDCLTMEELGSALSQSPFAQEKLDFVGFDACLMASLEVADLFSGYADYMIASEETEPGSGWDYSFLAALNESPDMEALAQRILESYETSIKTSRWRPEYTLSCLDLGKIGALNESLEGLYAALIQTLLDGGYSGIAQSRNDTKRFALSAVASLSESYDLVDLGSLLSNLDESYAAQAQDALACLEDVVVGQVTNLENVTGLSMYFPYDNKDLYQTGGDALSNTCMDYNNYESFLKAFTDCWLYGQTDLVWEDTQVVVSEEDYLTFTLTREQQSQVAKITYTVLEYDPDSDTYYPILANMQAVPDSTGQVAIPKNPDVFRIHTDINDLMGRNGDVWPMTLTEAGSEGNTYVLTNGRLLAASELLSGEMQHMQMSVFHDAATGDVTVQSVLSVNDDALFFGKQDIDITNYGCIGYFWQPLYLTYDAQGNLLSWEEWSNNGWYNYNTHDYEESFYMSACKLRDNEGIYYCQIVMTDVYGQVIGTRLEEVWNNVPYEVVDKTTAEGTLTYHVYADHAELVSYTPVDREVSYEYYSFDLVIPETVNGVSVTKIGPRVFYYANDLRSIKLPDTVTIIEYGAFGSCNYLEAIDLGQGLEYIGNNAFAWSSLREISLPQSLKFISSGAFAGSDLTTVTLPASVQYIGNGAFYGCSDLTGIYSDSAAYKSVDGVLFSADGRTLLAYPAGMPDTYVIPEGVEVIGPMAFRSDPDLKSVVFPEGLKKIGLLAFNNTTGLTAIDLPDSLQSIGAGAFSSTLTMNVSYEVEQIRIGPNVTWIGKEAFTGYAVKAYVVDPANPSFSSANGCLLNKSGTKLLQAPQGHEGTLTIPDGVSYIDWNSLDSCPGITELILPDSVVSISHAAGVPKNLKKISIGKGLSDWQNLDDFYAVNQIQISGENPNYKVVDGSIYSADMTVLYACRSRSEDFVIPDGVTKIAYGAFRYNTRGDQADIRTLTIPASVTFISTGTLQDLTVLERYIVAEGNPDFAAWDGLLYSSDGTNLYAVPLGRTGTIEVREGTVVIAARAFYSGFDLSADTVILPETVTVIRDDNFIFDRYDQVLTLYLPASLTDIHPDMFGYVDPENIEIHAPAGSAAEAFAKELGFEVIHD